MMAHGSPRLFLLVMTMIMSLVYCGNIEISNSGDKFSQCAQHATKTPYALRCEKVTEEMKLHENPVPSGCKPNFVLGVYRHGTRQLSGKDLKRLKSLEPLIQNIRESNPYQGALGWLNEWKFDAEDGLDDEKRILPEGRRELRALGENLAKDCPNLFSGPIHHSQHYVRSSWTNRTIESAHSFIEGAFGPKYSGAMQSHVDKFPKEADPVLRFFDMCPRYEEEIVENKQVYTELSIFKKRKMKKIAGWLSKQLGFEVMMTKYMTPQSIPPVIHHMHF